MTARTALSHATRLMGLGFRQQSQPLGHDSSQA